MKFKSVFDIIGPIMVGPSSSHTAGAVKIAAVARNLFKSQPEKVIISLYGSFAETYKGHGTDVALVSGLLGFDTFDTRIPRALEIAKERNLEVEIRKESAVMDHPNTAKLELFGGGKTLEIVGISIGGGKIEITELNNFKLNTTGEHPAILVVHHDKFGMIAKVTNILASFEINICRMEMSRKEKGKQALMVIEVDENFDESIMQELEKLEDVTQVIKMID